MPDGMDDPGELPYRRYGIPKLGWENYWYPVITEKELGAKPDIDGFLVGGASLKPEVRAREESHARLRRLDRECIASLPCTPLRCSLQRSCGRLLALSRRSRAMSESRLRMQEP